MRTRRRRTTDTVDNFMGQENARDLCDSIAAGDWPTVTSLYNRTSPSGRNLALFNVDGDAELPGLDEAVSQTQGRDPVPLVVRGIHGISQAWAARGNGISESVKRDGWQVFFDRLGRADVDLHRAARVAPADPIPWVGLLATARGLQIPMKELRMRFHMLHHRDPTNHAGHHQHLQAMAGKWTGTDLEMWDFSMSVHRAVPAGSPLHSLVATAFVERFIISAEANGEAHKPDLNAAADASIFHPDFELSDPIDRLTALTNFAQAFYYSLDSPRGKRTVEMIGPHPDPNSTIYVGSSLESPERWERLKKSFD